eukprot:1663799-Amphidinium_carterae.1
MPQDKTCSNIPSFQAFLGFAHQENEHHKGMVARFAILDQGWRRRVCRQGCGQSAANAYGWTP